MKTVLFIIPLKDGCLNQYKTFAKQTVEKADDYRDMLTRYDIYSVKIWHKQINSCDYIFVYHEVGPSFEAKMQGWDASDHSFDQWFRKNMMSFYNINDASEMETSERIIEFSV